MNKKKCIDIYGWLTHFGLSHSGALAVIGNWMQESGLNSNNLQQNGEKALKMTDKVFTEKLESGEYSMHEFIHDGYGYGLAQWTYYARKQKLYFYAKTRETKISDVALQCQFAVQEMRGYGKQLNPLFEGGDLRKLSDLVLTVYERPADMSEKVKQQRYNYALEAESIILDQKKEQPKITQQLLDDIINLKYDVYPKRKNILESMGYDYRTVQDKVNEEMRKRGLI